MRLCPPSAFRATSAPQPSPSYAEGSGSLLSTSELDRRPLVGHGPVGLALSSGAARGAAHAGVLCAIEEAGIEVSVITGSSAGALIGGAWAAGVSAEEIIDRVRAAQFRDFGVPSLTPRLGLMDTTPLARNLEDRLGDVRIEDLPIRFGAVVTELVSPTPRLVTTGSLVDAVRASSAVPGLFPPVKVDGVPCIDGGVLSGLPIWAAHHLGADDVIAVRFGDEPRWRHWLESRKDHPAHGQRADLLIVIDDEACSSWTPADVPAMIERGYETARAALAAWRTDDRSAAVAQR
jgi:NTE family protein